MSSLSLSVKYMSNHSLPQNLISPSLSLSHSPPPSIPITEAHQLYIKLAWIAKQGDDEDAFPEYNTSSIDLSNNVFLYQSLRKVFVPDIPNS